MKIEVHSTADGSKKLDVFLQDLVDSGLTIITVLYIPPSAFSGGSYEVVSYKK